MNVVQRKDIDDFVQQFKLKKELSNASFLITGATGLIGCALVNCLLAISDRIRVVVLVRNINKAKSIFEENISKIELINCDIVDFDCEKINNIDYIIHCAAPTSSKFFVEKPVETFNVIINGTRALLEYARCHPVKGFVYLSSLEVYGEIHDDTQYVSENVQGYLDPLNIRSSYPMAKRAIENLCCLYSAEYNIPVKIARLTQTTGAGIAKNDDRVIAQFARMAAQGKDIILHTTGKSARPYCYITDCVEAIFYILLKGRSGEAYNVANDETYISVKDMATFVKENINPNIDVKINFEDGLGYAPVTRLRLSSGKLRNLGWFPRRDLLSIFQQLVTYLKL